YRVFALTSPNAWQALLEQGREWRPDYAVLRDYTDATRLHKSLKEEQLPTELLSGCSALDWVASQPQVDVVMAAIVGAAGLEATLAAAKAGKKLLLANKESLVMGGKVFLDAVTASSATLLPIDSEHNAIFQCLPERVAREGVSADMQAAGISRILLTGSGGPFRSRNLDELLDVTPEEACAHPNWVMGRKISVDSATMMNKGLEFIEACLLFNCEPEQIDIVIHPQSVVHSMVEYEDGSVLAQLGQPDMRTPIAHALAWPERITSGVSPLGLDAMRNLEFLPPDYQRFPALKLAVDAARQGGGAPVVLNAANEIAVAAFLDRAIAFTDIAAVIEGCLSNCELSEPQGLKEIKALDREARDRALALIKCQRQAS
ncbi:1-deoxy-D-xylulose-5-phosphate reductoisomerase, partial [bacterium]|nr:1-deoxy-D-xylulose-5-phosphate reductoisomerase [bacterium]